ncbi:hypothetical protein MyNCGM683_25440 [Achromobacter xylosoxidans]
MHRGLHVGMVVAQARDRRAAGAIQVGAALLVIEPHALATDRDRGRAAQGTMKDSGAGHGEELRGGNVGKGREMSGLA